MIFNIFIIFLLLLSVIKSIFYGIYELNNSKNIGINMIIFSIFCFIIPVIIIITSF